MVLLELKSILKARPLPGFEHQLHMLINQVIRERQKQRGERSNGGKKENVRTKGKERKDMRNKGKR